MKPDRRAILIAVPLALLAAMRAPRAASSSWDGVWTGLWGGADETSIAIVDGKVASYSFKGATQPVDTLSVADDKLSFGTKVFTITLTRVSDTRARAAFQSNTMGVTKADLTRK